MRVIVSLTERNVCVDDVGLGIRGELPAMGNATVIHWDGHVGQIDMPSQVPGRFDKTFFSDESVVAPYVKAWEIERDLRAAERKAEEEAMKAHDAKIQAEIGASHAAA